MAAPVVRCPTCQRELTWSESFPFRPFCSERCRMVDLGAWFAGERRVAGDPLDPLAAAGEYEPRRERGE